jgi:hypothetical protein
VEKLTEYHIIYIIIKIYEWQLTKDTVLQNIESEEQKCKLSFLHTGNHFGNYFKQIPFFLGKFCSCKNYTEWTKMNSIHYSHISTEAKCVLLHENRFQGLIGMEFCSHQYSFMSHEIEMPMKASCVLFNVSWDTAPILQESVDVSSYHLHLQI